MRNVVIVGAGAALARPVIQAFLDAGDSVFGMYHSKRPDIPKHDNLFLSNRYCDVIDRTSGKINVLVTMTGSVDKAKILGMTTYQWEAVIQSTLNAPFRALRDFGVSLTPSANVVVVGSILGSTGGYGSANYAAAKAGLVGLVRAAANEWAANGICINLLELGYTGMGMGAQIDEKIREKILATIPLKRLGTEQDVVEAVLYLSRVRYMTGNVLTLAGGLR